MSDYFLNKIYDSLLANKAPKTKSTFRTLSESYGLIYEEELEKAPLNSIPPVVEPENKPSLPPTTPELNKQPKEETTRQIDPNKLPSNFDITIPTSAKWTQYQKSLFAEYAKGGTGKGETSVANVLTNIEDETFLKTMVSGGNEAFDVSWPPNNKQKTFVFEVKEMEGSKSVSIGKHGKQFATEILSQVEQVVSTLLQQVQDLSNEEEKNLSTQIAQSVWSLKNIPFTEPEKRVYSSRSTRAGEEHDDYKKELKEYNSFKNWSIKEYLTVVKQSARGGELPLTIIIGTKEPKLYHYHKDPEKNRLFLISLPKLITAIGSLKQQTQTKELAQAAEPRIGSLKDLFYRNYKPKETETSREVINKIENALDRKAITVDKELTRLKTKNIGKPITLTDFYNDIPYEEILQELASIKNRVQARDAIFVFFPESINGLFVVNAKGYRYFPRNEIPNYIIVDTFSRGGVKIRLKQ